MYGLNHWSSTGWRGPLLFSTVQISHFKLKWLRLNGTMQQQRWHCGLELKGQWLSTHGTVRVVLLLALGHQSWWQCNFFSSSHLLVWLWQFYKSEPKNKFPNNWLFAIKYKYFPKIGSAGAAGPRGRIFFSETGQLVIRSSNCNVVIWLPVQDVLLQHMLWPTTLPAATQWLASGVEKFKDNLV